MVRPQDSNTELTVSSLKDQAVFADLFNNGPFSYYIMDVEMKTIQMSQAAKNLTGFDSEDASVFHSNIENSGTNLHKDVLQSATITKGHFKTSYRYKKPDGSVVVLDEKGTVLTDDTHRAIGFVCVITDITLQEKLKEDFQAALAMAKFPLENPSPVFRVDKSGKLLFANKSSVDMLQAIGLSAGIITDKIFLSALSDCMSSGETREVSKKTSQDKVYRLSLVPQQSAYANVYTADITDSLKLQDELQDRLSDLTTILDSTDELVLLLNTDLSIRSSNNTYLQNISKAFAAEFSEGTSIKTLERLQFYPELEQSISASFEDGSIGKIDVSIPQGTTLEEEYFSININPIRKRGSNVISGVCLRIKDVTKEKRNLEAIQKQKLFYETILDNLPADIAIFSKDHRYLYVNPAGIRDKNLRQWIISKTDYEYCEFRNIDTRIADERSKLFQEVIASGKENEIETFHITKDGTTKHILRKFYPVYENGEFKLMIGYGVDITQIKESQSKLQKNENRYRALFESNPLPVIVIDLNGIIISTNSALLKETGHNPTEIIGQHIGLLLSEKGKNAFPDWFSSFVKDPETKYQSEIKVRNAKGALLDFEITIKKFDFGEQNSQILIVASNITERKKNATLLEESERLNRRLLQELPVSVITMVEGKLTHINNAFFEMLGFEPFEVIECPFVDFVHPDDRYLVEKYNFELFTGTDTVEYRVRMNSKSGEIRTVDIRETLFDLKSNMVTLALITDVTEKVAVENKNKEIEERTKLIIEAAWDGIVLTDSQLRIVDWNSKSAEIFQWGDRLLSGVELNQFFENNNKEHLLREGLYETSGMRSNGSIFPSEIFTARLFSGEKDLLVFYIRDITERVEVMKQLRDSERVEQILNLYNAEIYLLDNQVDVLNKMIATFHSICDLCHITVFEVDENGNAIKRINGVGEEFRLPIWNEIMLIPSQQTEIVEQAQSSCSMVIRTGVENGMEKSDLAIPLTIHNQTHSVVRFETGFTGLFSEGNQNIIRKMMDATSVRLSKIIDDQKLRKLNRELTQNNAQLQQYSYIVSHNLRAPIANLLGLSRLFNTKNLSDERNVKVIRNIESSAGNIDSILKDLNKILAIKRDLNKEKEEVNLDEIIYQVLKSLEREFIEVRPRIDLDMKVTKLLTIKSYITSIFTNLISNSIKYRDVDRDCNITIRTYMMNNNVCVEFEDNGMGIDLDKFGDQIFGLYKRYHRHVEGSGMGLHLVKSQIEAMGGTISVESAINKGTKFTIELYND